jgi:hypothetical protein
MTTKASAAAASKVATKAEQARDSERIGREAVTASEKLRAVFDAERAAMMRRYGVVRNLE